MQKAKKQTIAGMFLWEVEIEFNGWPGRERRTLTIATRRNTLLEAQRKTAGHLKAFKYDFPKAKIRGITYRGFIDA